MESSEGSKQAAREWLVRAAPENIRYATIALRPTDDPEILREFSVIVSDLSDIKKKLDSGMMETSEGAGNVG